MAAFEFNRPSLKKMSLVEVEKADLLRDIFPYTEIPKIPVDNISVPLDPADEIFITDTTFRDGQQARPPYKAEQIEFIFELLHKLGGPSGVIRQCEFFLYSDKDREAVSRCLAKGFEYPEVTGWIRAVKGDFELVKEMGLKETGILASISDYHIFKKLKKTRKEAARDYEDVITASLEANIVPRVHLEDVTRADVHGMVVPFAQRLMELSAEAGIPIKIRLPDTLGYGLPFAEAALPRSIPKLIHALVHEAGVPKERLEWHGHNDFHLGVAGAMAAWLYGCAAVNGSLLGTGERTGNVPVEAMIINYIQLTGSNNGIDTAVITEIGDYFKTDLGALVPTNYPFIGSNFNVTMAGIHANGVIKNEEIYNIFDTTKILNRPIGVLVTDKTGVSGVAYWVNHFLGLTGERQLEKHHPAIEKIQEWVQEEYDRGRTTAISRQEMSTQTRKYLPEYFDDLKQRQAG